MSDVSLHDQAWLDEQAFIEELWVSHPELITPDQDQDIDLDLRSFGITGLYPHRPQAHVNALGGDVLIREIHNKTPLQAEPYRTGADPGSTGRYLVVDLFTKNIATARAARAIAAALGVDVNTIKYTTNMPAAGEHVQRLWIKDATETDVKRIQDANIQIQPIRYEDNHAVTPLRVQVSVLVRTKRPLGKMALKELLSVTHKPFNIVGNIARSAHLARTGLLYATSGAKEASRHLFQWKHGRSPYHRALQAHVVRHFGNWHEVSDALEDLPHTARYELELARHLRSIGHEEAWKRQRGLVRAVVRSYENWVRNRYLSRGGSVHEQPSIFSNDADHRYEQEFADDGLSAQKLRARFPEYLRTSDLPVSPGVDWKEVLSTPEGIVLSFELPGPQYTYSTLHQLFQLSQEKPAPGWVKHGGPRLSSLISA